MLFHCCGCFSFHSTTISNEWKSNKCSGFELLGYHVIDTIDSPSPPPPPPPPPPPAWHKSNSKSNVLKDPNVTSSPLTSSSFLWIKFPLLTHLQRSEPLWSRPSFGSKIVRLPADRPPRRPSRHFPGPRPRSSLLWRHHRRPSPSTQSGEPLSPGPLPLAWWYVPLLLRLNLNTAEGINNLYKNVSRRQSKSGTKWRKTGRGKDGRKASYQFTKLKHERGISSDVVGSGKM